MASLLDHGLIKTAAIERVVAPIAARLCHLVLLCESAEGTVQFARLEGAAQAVAKATKNMATMGTRQIADTDDDVMRMEMSTLLEVMTVSGQHVLLAAQKLSIQPSLAEHREELITATQNVLLGIVKILLVEDDATVRQIAAAAYWVLECLSELGASPDIPSLLKTFQVFSESLLILNDLIVERSKALQDPRQTEHLKDSLETLRKCISMLHTAMCTTIKHPTSEQAQAAKRYIVDKVESTVNDIITTLKGECHRGALGPCGNYTERRNGLLRLLNTSSPSSIRDSDLNSMLRDLVFHCMVVANSSRREFQQKVVDNCRHVLQLWSDVARLLKITEDPDNLKQHLDNACASLMQQIQMLDYAMVKATLYQVIDTFVTMTTPFEGLVNMASQAVDGESIGELDLDNMQLLLIELLSQADRMIQVASFISAFATDAKSLENVENSRACLMQLKAGITPLTLELTNGSEQCSEAVQKLHDLYQRWEEETSQLQDAVCDVIDVREFTSVAVHEIVNDRRGCDAAFKEQSHKLFSEYANNLIYHMRQVINCVKRHIDRSDNPIYRNGLLVLLKQVETSQAQVVDSVRDMCSDSSLDADASNAFSDNASKVIKHLKVLREGLDGQQHPHLLSPLREKARQTIVSSLAKPIKEAQVSDMNLEVGAIQSPVLEVDKRESQTVCNVEHSEIDVGQPVLAHIDDKDDLRVPAVSNEPRPISKPLDFDLLPLLYEFVTVTKGKDVTILNKACAGVLELSNCYAQAAKEASTIVDAIDNQTLEIFRSELVTLTPLLIQTAQETAMSSSMSTGSIYKHSTLFSDLINNIRKVLLPVAGTWYHAIYSMFQSSPPSMVATVAHQLGEVMSLCADVVQLLTASDITAKSDCQESFTVLHSKLNKAQNSTRHLAELANSTSGQVDQLEGPCILWALSVQVLLNSLDKILGTPSGANELLMRRLTPQKRLAVLSENSLRIQEAARLTCLNCKNTYKVKIMRELQFELKTLTEAYLQVAADLGIVSLLGVLQLAKSEFLQRQLLITMRVLSCHLNKVNKEYVAEIQNIVNAAYLAAEHCRGEKKADEAKEQFENAAELLFENVKSATKKVQDCFNYIRDPRARSNLRSINDHLSFQISDIVSRARLMVETHCICNTLSLDIQMQCWSAKAHYMVEEIYKMDGIHQEAKEHIKNGLQGRTLRDAKEVINEISSPLKETDNTLKSWQTNNPGNTNITSAVSKYEPVVERQHVGTGSAVYSDTPSLTYTSLFLKQETDRWDAKGNRIVQVTREMADKIYHMAQYLRRKGPIQSKEVFVNTAKGVVSNCKSITQFVKVIANHCLDEHCTVELSLIVEQILTITNQLTIISSVNAVTPGSKSSDEILVKNAQNLLQIVLQGVRAAETACIKGLKQPEPNSDGAEAAALCFQWKRTLQIHRAQQNSNPETDDLGLRKISLHPVAPSLASPTHVQKGYKRSCYPGQQTLPLPCTANVCHKMHMM